MLALENVSARYGDAQALVGVSLQVSKGEIITMIGRNGAGKTTLLRCIMGLRPPQATGRITFAGQEIAGLPSYRRAKLGLGLVPDDRGILSTLDVEENLTLPPALGSTRWPLERVYEVFPSLARRRKSPAGRLSGGEQQMLALARMLHAGARMLLCDEPTEGLAPVVVQQIGEVLRKVKEAGVPVLLIEQNLRFATTVADHHYLLAEGRIVESLANDEVREREHELLDHLGV